MNSEKMLGVQNTFLQKLCTIFIFYLVLSSIVPQMRIIPGYTILTFLAIFMWFICAALAHPSFFIQLSIDKFFIFFIILYTVVVAYLFGNGTIGNRYLEQNIMFIFYLIYKYNDTYRFNNSNELVVKGALPFVIFTSIITLRGLISNPYLARSIKSSGEETMLLRIQGVGGYELIYFLVFFNIILFFIIINRSKFNFSNGINIGISTLIILFSTTVIYSNYFTALLIMIIAFTIIIVKKNRNILGKILMGILGIVFLVFNKAIITYILSLLIGLLGDGKTVNRLIDLQLNITSGYGTDLFLLERLSTLEVSWNAFLDNPVFGMVTKPIINDGTFLIGFGQHSYFLDTLALYGIVIGVVNVFLIIYIFLKLIEKDKELEGLKIAIMVSTIILLFMNNISTSIGLAIYFIYPTINDLLLYRIKQREYK